MGLSVLVLAAACVGWACGEGAAYDFDDPHAPHTTKAIEYDREGRRGDSRRAFESAARFTPSTQTLVNLGVCYMRLASGSGHRAHKLELYGLAYDAMKKGGDVGLGDDDARLFEENWDALMTNFKIENVAKPDEAAAAAPADDEALEPDHRVCGGGGARREPPSAFEQLMGFGSRKLGFGGDAADAPHREALLHQRPVPRAPPLPRVAMGEWMNIRHAPASD